MDFLASLRPKYENMEIVIPISTFFSKWRKRFSIILGVVSFFPIICQKIGVSIDFEKMTYQSGLKIDNTTFEKWGCFDCKYFPICGSRCPRDFLNNKEKRRCTTWKSELEYRLLEQYKLYLKEPEVFKNTPFNI